eukprot:5051624-Pyramimonas_sp.AAC.1
MATRNTRKRCGRQEVRVPGGAAETASGSEDQSTSEGRRLIENPGYRHVGVSPNRSQGSLAGHGTKRVTGEKHCSGARGQLGSAGRAPKRSEADGIAGRHTWVQRQEVRGPGRVGRLAATQLREK